MSLIFILRNVTQPIHDEMVSYTRFAGSGQSELFVKVRKEKIPFAAGFILVHYLLRSGKLYPH